jgi:hypothetical protein
MFYFALTLAAYLRNPTCYYLSFVFPTTLIWLLHCHAMHFDSFSLAARHLFQKLLLFFLCEFILVILTLLFSELKSQSELLKKSIYLKKKIF